LSCLSRRYEEQLSETDGQSDGQSDVSNVAVEAPDGWGKPPPLHVTRCGITLLVAKLGAPRLMGLRRYPYHLIRVVPA